MPNMTPEEARTLLDRLKHAGNVDDPVYAEVDEAIIPMLETIANLTWEWRAESTKGAAFASTPWTDEKEARDIFQKAKDGLAELGIDPTGHVRLIRRLVSQPEEVQP